ncbi:DUF2971 domain-containing protein [Terrabacter sp. NPDC080008]|uniref:DUF2971 domain-containing protein n=1 Tax=Terrabacter sp. NPDC080008 TaxID=3155176 RepID=UPI00344CFD6A
MFESTHESFVDQPAASQRLWRYMDLARYLSMLGTEALHFARADQMLDQWEGAYGSANVLARPAMYGEHYAMMEANRPHRREFARSVVHMNCWHLSDVESAAMWHLYQREGRGVAVVTDWASLTKSITSDRTIFGGRIKYIDYDTTLISEGNVLNAFMFKRESYAHEREVRLIAMTGIHGQVSHEGVAGVIPEGPVVPVDVNLSVMIKEVRVAPDAPDWIHGVVQDVTRRYGFDFRVSQSDLARDPIA